MACLRQVVSLIKRRQRAMQITFITQDMITYNKFMMQQNFHLTFLINYDVSLKDETSRG